MTVVSCAGAWQSTSTENFFNGAVESDKHLYNYSVVLVNSVYCESGQPKTSRCATRLKEMHASNSRKAHMIGNLLALGPRLIRMGGRQFGEDLVQETYISLRRSGASDASQRLIICVAQRKLVDLQRREARRRHEPLGAQTPGPRTWASDPVSIAENNETMEVIYHRLKFLSAKQREAFEVVYLSGESKRSDAERRFAREHGLSVNTVHTRVEQAKKRMRELISGGAAKGAQHGQK